jgi:hypothetical protein
LQTTVLINNLGAIEVQNENVTLLTPASEQALRTLTADWCSAIPEDSICTFNSASAFVLAPELIN